MKYTYACYSDIGKRTNNEDSYNILQNENALIAIVADGLGGHKNGEVASQIASEQIPQSLIGKVLDEDEMGYAIWEASNTIYETKSSACTTVAALWIENGSAIAAHVGDSRIYQFRSGRIIYQSEDHSLVQVEIALGNLPPAACRHHKDRNKVYRVLGEEDKPKVDTCELKIQSGDCFLLCSDGYWEPVTEEDMLTCLGSSSTPEAWLEAMNAIVSNADNPKQDNNTAIAIFVSDA